MARTTRTDIVSRLNRINDILDQRGMKFRLCLERRNNTHYIDKHDVSSLAPEDRVNHDKIRFASCQDMIAGGSPKEVFEYLAGVMQGLNLSSESALLEK